jgi:hypothetical protein
MMAWLSRFFKKVDYRNPVFGIDERRKAEKAKAEVKNKLRNQLNERHEK